MTGDDIKYFAMAIQSISCWNLALASLQWKKRLIPHGFAWSQNIIGALVILRVAQIHEGLWEIFDRHINHDLVSKAQTSMLARIHDIRQIDSTARRGWGVIESLYFNWHSTS